MNRSAVVVSAGEYKDTVYRQSAQKLLWGNWCFLICYPSLSTPYSRSTQTRLYPGRWWKSLWEFPENLRLKYQSPPGTAECAALRGRNGISDTRNPIWLSKSCVSYPSAGLTILTPWHLSPFQDLSNFCSGWNAYSSLNIQTPNIQESYITI